MMLRLQQVKRVCALAAGACALALVAPLAVPQTRNSAPVKLTDEMLKSTDYNQLDRLAAAELDAYLFENARRLYERSLEVRIQTFGEQSPEFAAGLMNLAGSYRAGRGPWQKAIELYRRALPIQEATLGADHPDVATTLYYLGRDAAANPHLVGNAAQRHAEALSLYQRALDIRTKAFGPSDPRVAEVLIAMAQLKDDEAVYRQALAAVDTGGQSSSLTATALELYAGYLQKHERGGEAAPLETRAKQIRAARVQEIGARRGPAPTAMKVKAASGVTTPQLQQPHIEPSYSDEARTDKVQGTVLLSIVVGTDGLAHDIQLKKGLGYGLDEKAAEAVTRWTFTPGMKDGQPVSFAATVEVNFKLL